MPKFGDDDFFINEDDDKSLQLSIVEDAMVKVLDEIQELAISLKENLSYGEYNDFSHNLSKISSSLNLLIEIDQLNNDDTLSDEEKLEAIESVKPQIGVMTLEKLAELKTTYTTSEEEIKDDNNGSDDNNDNSLDF